MNKYEIMSIPNDIDMTNPYGLRILENVDMVKVPYVSGMTLNAGEWTYDTDEGAYWMSPGGDGIKRGYIRLRDTLLSIVAGDEVEVEYEIKMMGIVPTNQKNGVTIDVLNANGTYVNALNFQSQKRTQEYVHYKSRKLVPLNNDITQLNIVIGTTTSPIEADYSFKIRNVTVSVKRNSGKVKIENHATYGIGESDLSRDLLIDNINTHFNSGARNINLKSGIYGFSGSGSGNESIAGNGSLIVLPYRVTIAGNKYVEQIAMVNSTDGNSGMWHRSYDGISNTWSKFQRYGEHTSVPLTSTSFGRVGDTASDSSYLYICHSPSVWKRVPLSTW